MLTVVIPDWLQSKVFLVHAVLVNKYKNVYSGKLLIAFCDRSSVVNTGAVAAILWGSWGPDPSLSASVGVQMCADPPQFLVPCCYTWPVIHSISSADSG